MLPSRCLAQAHFAVVVVMLLARIFYELGDLIVGWKSVFVFVKLLNETLHFDIYIDTHCFYPFSVVVCYSVL
jgi:hypothetical protein